MIDRGSLLRFPDAYSRPDDTRPVPPRFYPTASTVGWPRDADGWLISSDRLAEFELEEGRKAA